jgi:hypothetical protein
VVIVDDVPKNISSKYRTFCVICSRLGTVILEQISRIRQHFPLFTYLLIDRTEQAAGSNPALSALFLLTHLTQSVKLD